MFKHHRRLCYSCAAILISRRALMPDPGHPTQPNQQQVQIKADEKELLGQYANLAVIHHNGEEFTLNFIYVFPTVAQGKLVGSMILSPGHAKRLSRALQENIARYEAQFGTIPEGSGPTPEPNVGFIQ